MLLWQLLSFYVLQAEIYKICVNSRANKQNIPSKLLPSSKLWKTKARIWLQNKKPNNQANKNPKPKELNEKPSHKNNKTTWNPEFLYGAVFVLVFLPLDMPTFGRISFLCDVYGIVLQRRETEEKFYLTVCFEFSYEKRTNMQNDIDMKIILLNCYPV